MLYNIHMNTYTIQQSALVHFVTADVKSAPFWLIVRVYLGWLWLSAGYEKMLNPAWFGTDAGAALTGFVKGAVTKTGGLHPDVQMWYASFLQDTVLPNVMVWSNAVVLGEIAIGLGLIVGLCTGTAAFFAFFMNLNFMLSGVAGVNPIWMVLALGLMSAHRVAGYWGLDRYVPMLYGRWQRSTHGTKRR